MSTQKASQPTSYVGYSESAEVQQPNEVEDAQEVFAAFGRMSRFAFEKHRHGVRGAHAKSHGILKGEIANLRQSAGRVATRIIPNSAQPSGDRPLFNFAERYCTG